MRYAVLLLLMATPFAWSASIYRCTINGAVSYQDRPCPGGGGLHSVVSQSGRAAPSEAPKLPAEKSVSSGGSDVRQRLLNNVAQLEKERKRRELQLEIDRLNARIDGNGRKMDQELDAIRNKKRYANNTLAGATWEQSLSTEMNAVTSRYNIENITLRNKIHQLDEQLKQLN